jgi:hydroxyacylglutathione hydrolase
MARSPFSYQARRNSEEKLPQGRFDIRVLTSECADTGVLAKGALTMEVTSLPVGSLETNCYIVTSAKDCLVIDPGGDAGTILRVVLEKGLRVHSIVLTHGHFDHYLAAGEVQESTGAPVYVGAGDLPTVKDPGWMARYLPSWPHVPKDIRTLCDDDTVLAGELSFRVMSTPGHSPGSLCLYSPGVLFAGDLLFRGSIGRTDLPGGDTRAMSESLLQVGQLPDDTVVYPGHGPSTTVGEEKESNPYLG